MASKYDYLRPEIEKIASKDKTISVLSIAKRLASKHGLNKNRVYDWMRKKKVIAPNTIENILEDNQVRPTDSWSHAWLKTPDGSVFVKNKEELISYDDIRNEIIEDMKAHAPSYDKIQRIDSKVESHALTIDIADLHIGKLSVQEETGESYNMKKAVKRALQGVAGILDKASGYNIDKIFFIIGNDILHIDKTNRTTTANTPQDTDGMWYESFTTARKLYVEIIENLTQIADVHVIHCPSNHDFMSGYMLADSIYSWFNNNPNVTFDISNAHRKYTKYGKSLLGFSHGDGAKMADMPLLMANEAKKDWADTDFRYVYLHHIHHKDIRIFQSGKDYQGVTVEYLRSPSATDSWHSRNGYAGNVKAIEAFLHSKEYGQVAKIIHNFK
jgi:hypothetical protein